MFLSRPLIYIFICIKSFSCLLRFIQSINHFIRIYTCLQAEEYSSTFFCIQQIVTFVLSIVDTECITDILCSRMYLQTQVASLHRIEEVETDREVLTKASFYRSTQQISCLIEYQIVCRHFKQFTLYLKIQAVFLRNTVETPSEICPRTIQIAHFLHPLSTPRCRIEEWYYTERTMCCFFKTFTQSFSFNHLRLSADSCIQPIVGYRQQSLFQVVTNYPVYKITSLVLIRRSFFTIMYPQTVNFMTTCTQLDFPTRHIGIYQNISRTYSSRTMSIYQH